MNALFEGAERERNPFRAILRELDITADTGDFPEKIPESRACIVVANHPNGGSDALALVSECIERRLDTKVLANSILMGLAGVGKWMIPLDIMGENGAARRNQAALKHALNHLRGGGLLLVFPAGALSHWRGDTGRVADPPWSDHIARLARKAEAPVLPVRVFEKNPAWFTLLGALHLNVRAALVPRLLLSGAGNKLVCRPGRMILPAELAKCAEASEATSMMRWAVQTVPPPGDR